MQENNFDDDFDFSDLVPTENEVKEITVLDKSENLPIVLDAVQNKDVDKDFNYVQQNLKDIIEVGTQAIEELSEVARASQHPRAYEVLAIMIKNLTETNKTILTNHETKNNISDPEEKTPNSVTNNSIVFAGTTKELSELFKKTKNGK